MLLCDGRWMPHSNLLIDITRLDNKGTIAHTKLAQKVTVWHLRLLINLDVWKWCRHRPLQNKYQAVSP